MDNNETIIDIRGLKISFFTHVGVVQAVRGIDISLKRGESLGLVGESGCGKSVTSLGIMGLIQSPGKVTGGEIIFEGENLLEKNNRGMRKIRGNRIAMIFQDPMTSLNPLFTIGNQIREVISEHNKGLSKEELRSRSVKLLETVGIPDPESRVDQYAHEFSGGMRQRAMIAMALANNPSLLIADEPTTALDVTIQAQILDLCRELREITGTSIILITHDLGVVADLCDSIKVMYAGLIAEEGSKRDIFYMPGHPYTWGLLQSVPSLEKGTRQRLSPIEGQPPDLIKPSEGCAFAARCAYAMNICKDEQPPMFDLPSTDEGYIHRAACWLHHEDAKDRLESALRARNGGQTP